MLSCWLSSTCGRGSMRPQADCHQQSLASSSCLPSKCVSVSRHNDSSKNASTHVCVCVQVYMHIVFSWGRWQKWVVFSKGIGQESVRSPDVHCPSGGTILVQSSTVAICCVASCKGIRGCRKENILLEPSTSTVNGILDRYLSSEFAGTCVAGNLNINVM